MKTESILAALLEIQKQVHTDAYYDSTKLDQVKSSIDTLVAMLKKELESE